GRFVAVEAAAENQIGREPAIGIPEIVRRGEHRAGADDCAAPLEPVVTLLKDQLADRGKRKRARERRARRLRRLDRLSERARAERNEGDGETHGDERSLAEQWRASTGGFWSKGKRRTGEPVRRW